MPRIKLVTNVSDYAILRGLARTRARLVLSTAIATAATIACGLWSANYILEVSSSVGLNLALITFNMMLMLVAAYLQTVLLGDLTFSGPWREQVILAQATEGVSVKSHDAEFMILLLLLVIGNGLAVNVASGGFFDTYHTEGFFRSRLRSDDPSERLAALEYMTDPLNFELWEDPGVQDLVLHHLDDPDPAARRAAIWNAGEMDILEARDRLVEIAGDSSLPSDVRGEAAEAVGKMGNDDAARQSLESIARLETDERVLIGALRGLALMKSPLSAPAVIPLARAEDEGVMLHALWVLRNTGDPSLRPMVHDELEVATSELRRCALLDTLKMVATEEDVTWARRAFEETPPEAGCEPVVWEERNERQHYIMYSDSLRVKFLKIVANGSGTRHRAWFARLVADPQQPWRVREVASEIVKMIDESGR